MLRAVLAAVTETWAAANGSPPAVGVAVLRVLAEQLSATRRFAEAEPLARAAVKLATTALGERDEHVAQSLRICGDIQLGQARLADAENSYRQALNLMSGRQGREATIAQIYSGLGEIEQARGQFRTSESYHRMSLELRQGFQPDDDPEMARCQNALAASLIAQARYEEAQPLLSASLEVLERVRGPWSHEFAAAVEDLAALRRAEGRIEEACSMLERALEIRRGLLGSSHREVIKTLHDLAVLREAAGDGPGASELWEEAKSAIEPNAITLGSRIASQ